MKKTGFITSAILALTLGWHANNYAQSTSQRNSNEINKAQKIEKWVNNIDKYQDSVKKFLDDNLKNQKETNDDFYHKLKEVYDSQQEINNLKSVKTRELKVEDLISGDYKNLTKSDFFRKGKQLLRWKKNMKNSVVQDSVADYLNKFYVPQTTANFDFVKFGGNMNYNQFMEMTDGSFWGPISQVGKDRVRPDVRAKNLKKYGFETAHNTDFNNQGLNHFITTYARFRNFGVPTNVNDFKDYISFNKGKKIDFSEISEVWKNKINNEVLDFIYSGKNVRSLMALNEISSHSLVNGNVSKTHINWKPGEINYFPAGILLEKSLGMSFDEFENALGDVAKGYNDANKLRTALDKANAKKDNLVAQLDFENMMSGKYADNLRGMNKTFGKVAFGPEYGRNVTDDSYSLGGFLTMPGLWNSRLRISGSYSPRGQFSVQRIELVGPEYVHMEETKTLAGREYTAVENRGIKKLHQEMNSKYALSAGLGIEILKDIFLGGTYGREIKSGTQEGIEWIENFRIKNGNQTGYKYDEKFLQSKHVSDVKNLLGLYVAFQNILKTGIGGSIESNYDMGKKVAPFKPDNAKLNVNYDLKELFDYSVTLFK